MNVVRLVVGPFDDTTGTYLRQLFDHEAEVEIARASTPADHAFATLPHEAILKAYFTSTGKSVELAKIGTSLYEFLSQGDIGPAWSEARRTGARCVLDIRDPVLKKLPWELTKFKNQFLFKLKGSPHARFMDAAPGEDATQAWPLRVLVVFSEGLGQDIHTKVEARALERLLLPFAHSIDLQVLRDPPYMGFVSEIQRFLPHVFVFSGHCLKDPVTLDYGLFFNADSGSKYWKPTEIAGALESKNWHPRFVLLNACRTADPDALNQNEAVITEFLAAGVPACVAMQGDIRGDLAATFSSGVLARIAARRPLDEAVALARGDVAIKTDDADKQWSLPVLWLSAAPDKIFPPVGVYDDDVIEVLDHSAISTEVRMFADRQHERRAIRHTLAPVIIETRMQHVVLLTGSNLIGKSHLLKCLGEALTIGRTQVQYLPLSSKQSLDVIGLIRVIRDGDSNYKVKGLPVEMFHKFHSEFKSIRENGVKKPWNHEPCDDDLHYERTEGKSDLSIQMICASFLEALNEVGQKQPLVLILDQFRDRNELAISKREFRDFVWRYFLSPIRQGHYPAIRIVLAMRDVDCTEYEMETLIPPADWIVLQPFKREEYRRLASEYFWHVDEEDKTIADFFDLMQNRVPEQWSPKLLEDLKKVTDLIWTDKSHLRNVAKRR